MHRIIYDSGGIVDKHMGDDLLGIYGLSGEYVHRSALQAVSNLVDATPTFYQHLPEDFQDTKIAFGVSSGEIVCGVLGSEHRTELAVIGNCINRAARLQELTKKAMYNPTCPLGNFDKAMAICDEGLLLGQNNFRTVELTDSLKVRDFPQIEKVGVYTGAQSDRKSA